MTSVPKAALYYYRNSIWSTVALFALTEKGYGDDEVDLKEVDTSKGQNFAPTFLRINAKATVPTLVVPLEKTLQADMDVRFKALTDTKAIVEFLDKSRSALSRTHTTSSAPAPSLAPATIAFSSKSNVVIELLHSIEGDPNTLHYLSARNEPELVEAAKSLVPMLTSRRDALAGFLAECEQDEYRVSEKTKAFWIQKKAATEAFLSVYAQATTPVETLDANGKKNRQDYFAQAKTAWEIGLKEVLLNVNAEMLGPLVLGDQISLADMHLAPWLARVAKLSGASASDSGSIVVAKIENHIGGFNLPRDFQPPEAPKTPTTGAEDSNLPQSKIAAFWDAIKERPCWKKYYGSELH